jgi:hypothetical protein
LERNTVFDTRLVRRELERELIATARAGRPVSIQLVVRDAADVMPEAVRLQASDALQQLGLGTVPITVLAESQCCTECGWHGMPRRGQHYCDFCGAELPRISGRPVEAHVRHGGRRTVTRRSERRIETCR